MIWEAAIESVNRDIDILVERFQGRKNKGLDPLTLALRVLMARERIAIKRQQSSMVAHEA